jgi:V/A-type H+/Na+-transporting ATPase subunit I
MIVSMTKVTLLCLASDTDATLERLRDLGVLHVTHITEPAGPELDSCRKRLDAAAAALHILDRYAAEAAGTPAAGPRPDQEPGPDMDRRVERVHTLERLHKEFGERIAALQNEKEIVKPYGDFDPRIIDVLARENIRIKLCHSDSPAPPEPVAGAWTFPLASTATGRHFVVIGMDDDFDCADCNVVPHHRPLSVVEGELREARTRMQQTRNEIAALAADREPLRRHVTALEQRKTFLDVRAGMGGSGHLLYLQGFGPEHILPELRRAAEQHGWGLLLDAPSLDDQVPTLLSNPNWIRPIEALFKILGITPGYREVDISAAFMIFYGIFFAMLVGDAGYGVVFLALTILLRRFVPRVPRNFTRLLGLLSICTILWGVVTGMWFGAVALPHPLRALRIDWLRDDDNLMRLCFLIGAIQLSLAHGWVAARSWNRLTALAELGWIAVTWAIYFSVSLLVLGRPFPAFAGWMFVAGITAIFLFMTPPRALKRDFHKHVMLPLTLIGSFGDLISYVRLFAVGSATAAIAMAFNEMALGGGIRGPGQAVVASVILLAAHGLNLLLCALAVLVHGVRLNTLEFCGQMGIQWSGFPYKPFSNERTEQ